MSPAKNEGQDPRSAMRTNKKITLRPATLEDLSWLDSFYENLMRPYVELTHKWNPTKFRDSFDESTSFVIQLDEKDIGFFKFENRQSHFYLGDMQIVQTQQNNGIGSEILRRAIDKSESHKIPIRLRVLKGNPAIRLYERFGFFVIREFENSYELERKA